ncbi:heme-binding protein [Siminovitchia acidinfaciens]|uniref:Heme-binding protein n=1 Tax=Siminovitchia acidinfaciens TaxID=2321395 RepID=A0A429XZP6_9BACI|nr:heme-binding protein [Siminovitchia acidinfaciens]RST74268.1 heme-binding protein [Siminovitchia acidinfaciens]VEF49692.1 Uncharacterized conserved protein [Bacillus freudenreichii]
MSVTEKKIFKTAIKLELEAAKLMIEAAKKKSEEINVAETIAIVDEGGNLIALERMNEARITGPEIAIAKAFTAAGHKRSTHLFNTEPNGPALPGNEAYGIQLMFPGKFAIFVGGFPIVVDGEVVGGVGISGGNGEQDTAVGTAALQALQSHLEKEGMTVETQADIKK